MDVNISGRNIKVTAGLEDYARRKIERLDRYLPNIRDIRVDLATQNNSRGDDMSIAQITVQHERGAILRAEEKTTGEIHQAIDTAVDKMYRQIRRFKGKRISKNRRNKQDRFVPTVEELEAAEDLPLDTSSTDVVDVSEDSDSVVRRKIVALTPMDESEAIDQMELLGHNFFMFYNAESGKVNVVYRRSTEGYGLLEPMKNS
jgi:putative sigma-54 modulation protein